MPTTRRMSPRARKEVDTSTYGGRFAARLRMLREKAGYSVEQLAEASGVPRTTIFNWESGISKPLIDDSLLNLAKALEIRVRTLMPDE